MLKINWNLLFGTIFLISICIFLAIYLYSLIGWFGFLLICILASLGELLILNYSEKKKKAQKKQKIAQLRLLLKEDIKSEIGEEKRLLIEALNKKTQVSTNVLENFRVYLHINTAELNELLLEIDKTYLNCIELVKNAKTEKAKEKFNATIFNIFNRIFELDNDFNYKIKNLFTSDLKFKKIIASFKEEWETAINKIKNVIKETQEKFEIDTNFIYYIEDIFRFEIENKRMIQKEDFQCLNIPNDQIKKLLKYIDKPVKLKLNELDGEKKKKLGELGKKIIAYYVNENKKPNLPELTINLGIGITESKEILSYLKEIGMIDEVKYHIE